MTASAGQTASSSLVRWLPERLRGLKGRLALVVALVLLVPTAFAVVQAMRVLAEDQQRQRETLERTLALITGYHDQVASQATQMLASLAARDEVVGRDAGTCDRALAVQVKENSLFIFFAVTDAQGRITCGSQPDLMGLSYGDRPWFRSLAAGQLRVASSGVVTTQNPAIGQTLVAGIPIRAADGHFQGMVAVALKLDELISLPLAVQLPADTIAAVVDDEGEIATSRGDLPRVNLDQAFVRALVQSPATPLTRAGERGRLWQFMARRSDISGMRTAVLVGLPKEPWGWLDARFQSGILLPTSILFLSVFVVWVATDVLITRPLLKLAGAVRKWRREGEMPPLHLDGAPEELEELAHAFRRASAEIKERDRLLQTSLQEKDLLLREIHHRVKNNLQIVTSLLNLRSNSLRNVQAQQAMREAQLGIKALALVHRKLYERLDLKQVALDELLEELCPLVHDLPAGLAPKVELSVNLEQVVVAADQATPLALLCTELLSNAAKHAFPTESGGLIDVRLEHIADGRAKLTVADNGVGMSASQARRDRDAAGGMGLRLIQMFARQVGAELTTDSDETGTRASLLFRPGSI